MSKKNGGRWGESGGGSKAGGSRRALGGGNLPRQNCPLVSARARGAGACGQRKRPQNLTKKTSLSSFPPKLRFKIARLRRFKSIDSKKINLPKITEGWSVQTVKHRADPHCILYRIPVPHSIFLRPFPTEGRTFLS